MNCDSHDHCYENSFDMKMTCRIHHNNNTIREIDEVEIVKQSILSSKPYLSQLHMGAFHGNLQCVQQAIFIGSDINAFDENGLTPLMIASQRENIEIVQLLLLCGVNVHASTGKERVTSLHLAVCNGNHIIVQMLWISFLEFTKYLFLIFRKPMTISIQ